MKKIKNYGFISKVDLCKQLNNQQERKSEFDERSNKALGGNIRLMVNRNNIRFFLSYLSFYVGLPAVMFAMIRCFGSPFNPSPISSYYRFALVIVFLAPLLTTVYVQLKCPNKITNYNNLWIYPLLLLCILVGTIISREPLDDCTLVHLSYAMYLALIVFDNIFD